MKERRRYGTLPNDFIVYLYDDGMTSIFFHPEHNIADGVRFHSDRGVMNSKECREMAKALLSAANILDGNEALLDDVTDTDLEI